MVIDTAGNQDTSGWSRGAPNSFTVLQCQDCLETMCYGGRDGW